MDNPDSLSINSHSELCGLCTRGEAKLTYRSQVVGKGAKKVTVENVPMHHCSNCNGTYFSREVALSLENIRLHPENYDVNKVLGTVDFLLMKSNRTKKRGRPDAQYETCVHCQEPMARWVKLSRAYKKNRKLIVIEDVPIALCDNCGLSFISDETQKKIDEILANPKKYTQEKEFLVADFKDLLKK